MGSAFVICVFYALAGCLYAPGLEALVALAFISVSAAPLLWAARASAALPALPHPAPSQALFWLLIALGLFNLVLIAWGLDRDPAELLNPEGFVLLAAEATARRYQDEGSSGNPVVLALSLFLIYRVGAAADRLARWRQVLAFVPILAYTLLSTEKWPMFLAGAFYLFGMFAAFKEAQALRRAARVALLFVALGFVLAGVALILRGFDGDMLELPAQLLHYVLAPFPALGHWLMTTAPEQCCGAGIHTFIGAANQLGLARREAGVFAENFQIYGQETNIFSAWRYLVQDFSLLGPLAINGLAALVCLRCLALYQLAAARAIKGLLIAAALLSLNVTPFVHNSVSLAVVLALAYSASLGWAWAPTGLKTSWNPRRQRTYEQVGTMGV